MSVFQFGQNYKIILQKNKQSMTSLLYFVISINQPVSQARKEHNVSLSDRDLNSFLKWYNQLDSEPVNNNQPFMVVCNTIKQEQTERKNVDGKVTKAFGNGYGLVDHHIYFSMKDVKGFDNNDCPSVGDLVHVEAEKCRSDGGWTAFTVVSLKHNAGWNENDDSNFRIPTHYEEQGTLIGVLTSLNHDKKHFGTIENDIKFEASELVPNYNPNIGDWVKSQVVPGGIALKVEPLRVKEITGVVTYTCVEDRCFTRGAINNEISFDKKSCKKNYCPRRGDEVMSSIMECKLGRFTWRAIEIDLIQRKSQCKTTVKSMKKTTWVLCGDKPRFSEQNTSLPSFLPQFSVPEIITTCLDSGGNLLAVRPVLKQLLTAANYAAKFSTLLHLEEISLQREIDALQMHDITLTIQGEFLSLVIPGISDGRPCLAVGDSLILDDPASVSGPEYRGFIHHICVDTEEVFLKFHQQLHIDFDEAVKYNVSFNFSRLPFRRCHLAVQHAKQHFASNSLFSNGTVKKIVACCNIQFQKQDNGNFKLVSKQKNNQKQKYTSFNNPKLNDRQRKAVFRILRGEAYEKPYVLFGPPGTGKTVTLVEAVLQILQHNPSCRLLLCAPSNSAVDLLCERLHASGHVTPKMMVRFNAFRRPASAVPDCIQPYCHPKDSLQVISRYKIVLSTCVNAGMFYTLQLRSDHFTHVCVDESGQATEPECLIPIGLCPKGQIVLVGDPQQLGAVLRSPYAIHYQLGISLLERLMSQDIYQYDASKYIEGYNELLVTKLVKNYRSHPAILSLPSKLFYHDELKPCADESLKTALCSWNLLPVQDFPVFFHAIMGKEFKEGGCQSFFNPSEIVQVVQYTKQLLISRLNVLPSDIGIITPYRKQVEKLRLMLKSLKITGIKVGSVEEFQGQEKKVVIVSTVRSRTASELSDNDGCLRSILGFVSNAKRFNVAITRAQSLLVVVGNPIVLKKDDFWRSFLEYCIQHKAYINC
uniref:RNA helicase n=1 Tax=Phallusia mammillata TaxID=59560 RepID=A0A6F9DKD2_9ASCI|nr:putative helicase Mov10l1 [Phallusia mammillata]